MKNVPSDHPDRSGPMGSARPGPPSPLTEERTLQDILDLAGPELAPTLMRQIRLDVTKVRDELAAHLPQNDTAVIRSASHVLISLAGTIGAPSLRAKAIDLNTAARSDAAAPLARIGAAVLADLEALILDLSTRAARMQSGGTA